MLHKLAFKPQEFNHLVALLNLYKITHQTSLISQSKSLLNSIESKIDPYVSIRANSQLEKDKKFRDLFNLYENFHKNFHKIFATEQQMLETLYYFILPISNSIVKK